ncbi:hypothetical protein BDU57DRAFT_581346 [Ampelomyces quisqualis]|uniref:Uncharacterized protein n=1 Tax=Ampelomyces quisqualis TaxID=50730 RepID=A0A6A5QC57_AMPQU|nr:hypothetical protein BDU57DRAFT_581346 [Ampelomyces quisqualis]
MTSTNLFKVGHSYTHLNNDIHVYHKMEAYITVAASYRPILPLPLPHSFAALFKAFNAPAPKSYTASARKSRYLNRSLLRNDATCNESTDLIKVFGTIIAFSDRYPWNEALASELDAGVRYWLPSGKLAEEWKSRARFLYLKLDWAYANQVL